MIAHGKCHNQNTKGLFVDDLSVIFRKTLLKRSVEIQDEKSKSNILSISNRIDFAFFKILTKPNRSELKCVGG